MHCRVTIKHKNTDANAIGQYLESLFAERSVTADEIAQHIEWLYDYAGLHKSFIYGNSLGRLSYAFLRLDSEYTQVWVECSMGRETFAHLERIVGNGIRAIDSANGKSAKCRIETSVLYEQSDKDSLELAIERHSILNQLRETISIQNLIALVVIWGLSALLAWLNTPIAERSLKLLLTPSWYAPAGVSLVMLSRLAYNLLTNRNKVVVNVAQRT